MFTSASSGAPRSGAELDEGAGSTSFALSRRELLTMISATMALTAVAIDLMLPAFDEIRDAFDLRDGSADTGQIVTVFFVGMALGQVGFGPVADRFGRKRTLYVGIGIYLVGAGASAVAPTFGVMLGSRFLWGVGAAGARVAIIAVIRDRFEGEAMATAMSRIMAVFVLVPIVAPAIGSGIVAFVPWRGVFWACVVWGAGVFLWTLRLPETLAVEHQRPLSFESTRLGFVDVARTRITGGYSLAAVFIQAVFTAYVASSEVIISDIFDLREEFPYVFGAVAVLFALGAIANGRLVAVLGIDTVVVRVFAVQLTLTVCLLIVSIADDGTPSPWAFLPILGLILASFMFLLPNLNAAALLPVGHIAGTAAALTGAFRLAAGAVLGTAISSQVTDSVTPFACGVAIMCFASAATVAVSRARSPRIRSSA